MIILINKHESKSWLQDLLSFLFVISESIMMKTSIGKKRLIEEFYINPFHKNVINQNILCSL